MTPEPIDEGALLDLFQPARYRLMVHDRPYLSLALAPMVPVFTRALPMKTAAVDRYWRLYLDPEFFTSLSLEERCGLLVHELLHLLNAHGERAEAIEAEPQAWAIATDLSINGPLLDEGMSLPGNGVFPQKLQLEVGLLAEEYYYQMPPLPPQASPCGGGSGVDGQRRDWELPGDDQDQPGVDPAESEAIRDQTAKAVLDAESSAPGKLPGGMVRWAQAQMKPRINWLQHLRAGLRSPLLDPYNRQQRSFRRLSRRTHDEILLPGHTGQRMKVALVADTSGSMSEPQLARLLTETRRLFQQFPQMQVSFISCDYAAAPVQRVHHVSQIKLIGGGGTDMGVGLAAAEQEHVDACILISDLDTPWPAVRPKIPKIIIVSVGTGGPPPWNHKLIQLPPDFLVRG